MIFFTTTQCLTRQQAEHALMDYRAIERQIIWMKAWLPTTMAEEPEAFRKDEADRLNSLLHRVRQTIRKIDDSHFATAA